MVILLLWATLMPLAGQGLFSPKSSLSDLRSRLDPVGAGRFSLENRFFSSYLAGADGTAAFTGGYLATLGWRFAPEWKADLTLGYRLADWSTGRDWQFGQSLSLSNIKGASVEWRGKSGVSLRLQVGQAAEDLTGFGTFGRRFQDDLFGRDADALTGTLGVPLDGEKARFAVSISTPTRKP